MTDNNLKSFSHISRYGTQFYCIRADFKNKIYYKKPDIIEENRLMCDVGEMVAFHAMHIWPTLNGFSGYDTLVFIEDKTLKL